MAVEYLLSEQDLTTGLWGEGEATLHTTAEVVRALKEAQVYGVVPNGGISAIPQAIFRAHQGALSAEVDDLERESLFVTVQLAAGRNIGAVRASILNQQQFDGGWGITVEHRSNVRDTFMVAEGLLWGQSVAVSEDRLLAAINFLNSQMQSEAIGMSWKLGSGGDSSVMTTARGLCALRMFGDALGSESAVYDATLESLAYLVDQVDPYQLLPIDLDGSWLDGSDTETYATILRAYSGLRQPGELELMVNTLLAHQVSLQGFAVGAWASDGGLFAFDTTDHSYPTALMVRALLSLPTAFEDDAGIADLAATVFAVSAPSTGQSDFLSIDQLKYQNTGGTVGLSDLPDSSPYVNIQFYSGDPRAVFFDGTQLQRASPVGSTVQLAAPIQTTSSDVDVSFLADQSVPLAELFDGSSGDLIVGVKIDSSDDVFELDELNNVLTDVIGTPSQTTSGPDLAIKGGTLRVDHVDLAENPVVRLRVGLWNQGDADIPAGKVVRVYFRAGTVLEGFTINDLVSPGYPMPTFQGDPLLIDYADLDVDENLGSLQDLGEVEVEWIPVRSQSRTVTVVAEVLDNADLSGDSSTVNNMDERTFDFSTGDLVMTHRRAANFDLLFDIEYGNNCYNPNYGFAAYYRQGPGEDWIPIENSPYGPSGGEIPCSFRLSRAQAWQIDAGLYQALGEVWYENPVSGLREFIGDDIIPFSVPEMTSINAIFVGFADDSGGLIVPQEQSQINVGSLQNARIVVYFDSNTASFSPQVEIELVEVDTSSDLATSLVPPVELTSLTPTSVLDGQLEYLISLDSFDSGPLLLDTKTYELIARVSGGAGVRALVKRFRFTLDNADGFVLQPKRVFRADGVEVTDVDPVPASDGETVQVVVPVRQYTGSGVP